MPMMTGRRPVARSWQPVVDGMSRIQKLVHLSVRQDPYDAERIRQELLRERRRYYEAELTAQAARVGCPGRVGRLTNGHVLSLLNEASRQDAESIVNTYNYDLALAIGHIRAETPTANRYVYAKRLRAWESARASWKNDQIATFTEMSARSLAQQHFYQYNSNLGTARLMPLRAVCPVCQGWINRGEVPLYVAQANPPPYHAGCPHAWETTPGRVSAEQCPLLWMGGE